MDEMAFTGRGGYRTRGGYANLQRLGNEDEDEDELLIDDDVVDQVHERVIIKLLQMNR